MLGLFSLEHGRHHVAAKSTDKLAALTRGLFKGLEPAPYQTPFAG
jgi:hypothetical protein